MKVALVFVPQWTAAHPHHSISALAAELRRAGHGVEVIDLNLTFMEWVLEPSIATFAVRRAAMEKHAALTEAKLRIAVEDRGLSAQIAGEKARLLEAFLERWEREGQREMEQWAGAPDALRDARRFYDPPQFIAASAAIDRALEAWSLPFFPAAVRWNDFSTPHVRFDLEPMLAFCDDRLANPFHLFFERQRDRIWDQDADMIALSIGAFSQVLPGLTLARMLKKRRDQARHEGEPRGWRHLSLGGNFFSRLRDGLTESPGFFEVFTDSVVIGEGEVPVVQLARALDHAGDRGLAKVSSLVYRDADTGRIEATDEAPPVAMNELAFVDLDGLELSRYHAPEPVLSLRASKGCYWGHCVFCDSHYGLHEDVMEVERFVEELRHVQERYGIRHFELIDQCIPPDHMVRLCDAIVAAELDVHWFCNARTEPGYTRDVLAKMRAAGATKIMWGVETGSPRLLKLMRKGVEARRRLDILAEAEALGLWNFAYVFFGFPTESRQEAERTIDLIVENTDVIHSYGRSIFSLGKHSPMMERLDEFAITGWRESDQAFSVNLTFDLGDGLRGDSLREVVARCTQRARQAYGDPLWMALRSRETLHLYLAERGRDWVRDYRLDSLATPRSSEEQFVF